MNSKLGKCNVCGRIKVIQNSRDICVDCVYEHNHGGKTRYQVARERLKKEKSEKRKSTLEKDREFYHKCFIEKPQICENCGKKLPGVFEDDSGKLIAIYRYSHILPKSTYPKLRHRIENINILCADCHYKWDFGDKKKMKIYESNNRRIAKLTAS